jgi:hypothetical protein
VLARASFRTACGLQLFACLLACSFYHLYFASRDDTAAMDAPHAEIESRVLSCIKPQFRAPVSSFAPRPCHICAGTGRTPATSAPGLGSPLPHLHRDWAHPCHICTGTGRPGTCTRTPPPLVPVLHTVLRLQIACCLASATSESRRIFLEVRLNVACIFQVELGAALRAGSCAGG